MQTEVFIAGAGIAGLSLAASLQRRGIDYCLAEARDRTGGRILSVEPEDAGNAAGRVDLGPSWIWPGQGHIAALLNELGIEVCEQYSDGRLVYEDELGQVRRDLDYSSMAGSLRIDGGMARVTERLAAMLPADAVLLSHRVCALREERDGYRVELVHPGGELVVAARKVVLAIPTWMAGHAKLVVFFDKPFWREQGLSGDGISRRGPLMEIHDACARDPAHGVLFGFVGLAAGSALREPSRLIGDALRQLERMYGAAAANPLDVVFQDWAKEQFTATAADQIVRQHPAEGAANDNNKDTLQL